MRDNFTKLHSSNEWTNKIFFSRDADRMREKQLKKEEDEKKNMKAWR